MPYWFYIDHLLYACHRSLTDLKTVHFNVALCPQSTDTINVNWYMKQQSEPAYSCFLTHHCSSNLQAYSFTLFEI